MPLLEAGDTTGQKEGADDIFVSGFKHNGHDTIPLSCCQTWNYNIFLCSFHRVQIPLGMHNKNWKKILLPFSLDQNNKACFFFA